MIVAMRETPKTEQMAIHTGGTMVSVKIAFGLIIGLLLLICVSNVLAQENSSRKDFDQFKKLFVGGEWSYRAKMTNAAGEVTFEGSDVRTFTSGMRGNYLIENVFNLEGGERIHVAIQLAGFDRNTGLVHLSQFWPWQATKLGDVTARLHTQADGLLRLIGTARPADQDHPVIDINCGFTTKNRYECVAMSTNEGDVTYQSNHEIFERRSPP